MNAAPWVDVIAALVILCVLAVLDHRDGRMEEGTDDDRR